MADEPASHAGLPWPEAYAALLPEIRKAWRVEGEIYLVRQLSGGKSGALVLVADMTTDRFSGQAILKLDRAHHTVWNEVSEADRHRHALEAAPDFAAAHLPLLLHSLHHGEQVASLSTIAAGGLEYASAWFDCPHDRQLNVARRLSKEVLEDWNRDYRIGDGVRMPPDLLRKWLGYRIDPQEGRIYPFVTEKCGLAPDEPSFVFEGRWYPNPLAFAAGARALPEHLRLRAAIGSQHGDFHGNNILVSAAPPDEPDYYIIDLAMYEADQFLFFDHAYLELSYLLRAREAADWRRWEALLDCLGQSREAQDTRGLPGDDLGLIQMSRALRDAIPDWIAAHEGHRVANMDSQVRLARVGAGLSWTNKIMPDVPRQMAFLYAASNLKDYLDFHNVDWPKHGPALALVGSNQGEAPAASPPVKSAPSSPVAKPAAAPTPAAPAPVRRTRTGLGIAAALAVVVVAALAAGLWLWQPWTTAQQAATAETGAPTKAERPSLVVLPFESLPADAQGEMLAGGMTSALTAALAQVPELEVISRRSAQAYKGTTVDVRAIARDLKVGYVLNGTLQHSAGRVRVAVELINGATGRVAWSRKFEDAQKDVFKLEDEIALKVLVFLQVKLTEGEQAEVRGEATNSLQAYLLFVQAQKAFRTYTKQGMVKVRDLASRIHKLDPDFRPAYILDGASHVVDALFGYGDVKTSLQDAAAIFKDMANRDGRVTNAERAIILSADAAIDQSEGRFDAAIEAGEKAVALAPNNADVLSVFALVQYYAGNFARSIALFQRAMRVHPVYPSWYSVFLARAYAFDGDTERAIRSARDGIARSESDLLRAMNMTSLVFAYREAKRDDDARKEAEAIQKFLPDFSAIRHLALQPFKNRADSQRFSDAVHAAGLT